MAAEDKHSPFEDELSSVVKEIAESGGESVVTMGEVRAL
jgi:hypothetical protein